MSAAWTHSLADSTAAIIITAVIALDGRAEMDMLLAIKKGIHMGKSIVLIHGHDFKPPRNSLKTLWVDALRFGIERDHPTAVKAFDKATIEWVYYGDISNDFLTKAKHEAWYDDTASRRKT